MPIQNCSANLKKRQIVALVKVANEVPTDWDEAKDCEYVRQIQPGGIDTRTKKNCRTELIAYIYSNLEDFHGVLTFAFCFLTGQPYEPESIFRQFPTKTKVEMVRKLIHQRSQNADYLKRFERDFKNLLDVETVSFAVLERYLVEPQNVWMRELVDVSDNIVSTIREFSESLECEHRDCPKWFESR
jgi:hypothetical protein